MTDKTRPGGEDLLTMSQVFFLDLPFAGTRWGLGIGGEREVIEATWKGYDASVRLATTTIDNLYRNPLFSEMLSRSLHELVRWQRLSNALVGAFFTGVWRTMGLPTAAEVQTLHEEIRALTTSRAVQSAGYEALLQTAAVQMATTNTKAWQEVLRTLRHERSIVPLREDRSSSAADLLVHKEERMLSTADLLEYFESVEWDANSAPSPEQEGEASSSFPDLLEYFESVEWDANSAPSPEQKTSEAPAALEVMKTEREPSTQLWGPQNKKRTGQSTAKATGKGGAANA